LKQHAYRDQFAFEDEHWWFQGRRAVLWALLHRAGVTPGVRVLDAGCGTGRNVIEFASLGEVHGVDSSPEAIGFCRRRGISGVVEGKLEQLPFADGEFGLVVATDVLEHVPDDVAAARELRRVAAPDGHLLVTVPAYQWLWSQHDDAYHHFRRYTWRQLRTMLNTAGWEPVTWSYFNSFLLPAIAAVRVLTPRRRGGNGRPDLHLTPQAINRLLLAPMRAEASLIERGRRLPAGVSVGAVCRPV
jgi:SAM-dependent methyltransferase